MTAAAAKSWEDQAREFVLAATGVELGRRIGEGGAGRTFAGQSRPGFPVVARVQRAVQELVPRENWPARVCCKLIPPDSKLLAYERDGIRRVAGIQQRQPHPHLLTLLGHADFEGGFVELMELADEVSEHSFQTLEHHIWAQMRLSLDEAYTITRCLAEAAQHLRNHDRRHQDIKPANVVRVGGVWKLADFGAVIIESQSGVEGRLTREPYGPDTAGLARTLYAMLGGEYLSQPCDPLPEDLLPLGDRLHDELILPAARESESIKSPAQFLNLLDWIYSGDDSEPELPPAEHVRKLADAMAAHVSRHNRGVFATLGSMTLACSVVAAASSVASVWWLPRVALVPPLLAAGLVAGVVTWYRRLGEFWTVPGLAQWIVGRGGTPNLIPSALDYACGAESGLARAERQVWLVWPWLDGTVPFERWLSDAGSRVKLRLWSLTPRWLRPRDANRRVAQWREERSRVAAVPRLIEPHSDFAADLVRRAERQFAALMPTIPSVPPLIELLKRWGNRLLGLAAGLLLLGVLWFACSMRQPAPTTADATPSASEEGQSQPQPTPDQPQPETPGEQPTPAGGDAGQTPEPSLDRDQLQEAVRQAQKALDELARQATQAALNDAGVSGQELNSDVEKFVAQANQALSSAGSSGAKPGGGKSSPSPSQAGQSPNGQSPASTATAEAGTSPGQSSASQATSGSQPDPASSPSGGAADSSTNPSGQQPPSTSPSSGGNGGQSSTPQGTQAPSQPPSGSSKPSPHGGGKPGNSPPKAGLNSGQQPPGSGQQPGQQGTSNAGQQPAASGAGQAGAKPPSGTNPSTGGGSQGQGSSGSGASAADLQGLAQQAATALQQAQQALSAATPSSASGQRAAQAAAGACAAAAQSLQALAAAGQAGGASGGAGNANASGGEGGGKGGRPPGTGHSPDGHSGGQAVQVVLDGRVISVPLDSIRGGEPDQGSATPVKISPSSLQRRSEGESADAMILDEHKKRALNAILAPQESQPQPPGTGQPPSQPAPPASPSPLSGPGFPT